MVSWKRASALDADELFFKLLLYGDSGAGKTHLISTATNPQDADATTAIILTEQNGVQTARHANPNALISLVSTAAELREAMRPFFSGDHKGMGVRRLALDGLTEIQQLFKREIVQERGSDATLGESEFSMREWGMLHEKMRRFLATIRAMKIDVVCTALAKVDTDDANVRHVQPAFQGSNFHNDAMQFFNAVGLVYKAESRAKAADDKKPATKDAADAQVQRLVMLDGPAKYLCKTCSPLRGTMTGPLWHYFDALAAPTAPLPAVVKDAPVPEEPAGSPANPPRDSSKDVTMDESKLAADQRATAEEKQHAKEVGAKPVTRRRRGATNTETDKSTEGGA